MTRVRNRGESSSFGGNSFSFIIPFVIALIVLVLVIKYIFSGTPTENQTGAFMTVTAKQDQSEIYIYMSGDSKKRIDSTAKMYTNIRSCLVEAEAAKPIYRRKREV